MNAKKRKNLGEQFDTGSVQCVDRSILEMDLTQLSDQVEELYSELAWGELTPARRTGRPARGSKAERTSTRSVRFPDRLWAMLAEHAEQESITVNRFLERAAINEMAMVAYSAPRAVEKVRVNPAPAIGSTVEEMDSLVEVV